MAFKLAVVLAFVSVANAAILPTLVKKVELEAPAEYQFSYSVHDDHTGDIKSQQEERHGDDVKGQYTLIDADGYRRVVDYTADEHNGFNAVVRREPLSQHKLIKTVVPVAKVVVPVAKYAVPVTKVVAPAHHLATVSFAAPSLTYHY
uniref:Uncharacterized protein n=1 Tax=Anopheles albimanus TaxID=7167 RepID=A0A8W7K8W9_ANOAL